MDPENHPSWPIRPYQSLLLLPTAKNVNWVSLLPSDASNSLKKFIELAKPTKSFRELQVETDIPLAQLYRFSAHLVYWNSARIINTLTKTNVYVLNSEMNEYQPNFFRTIAKEFSSTFTNFRFAEIITAFSKAKSLGEHLELLDPARQRDFIEVTIWLLQRNLLKQQHVYVYLLIDTEKRFSSPLPSEKFPAAPTPLTPLELEYLETHHSKDPNFPLFKRLCPYFRGRHHLEEIMFRENITREELLTILTTFKGILSCITC